MGYTHGNKWSDEALIVEINKIVAILKIGTMPSKTQMIQTTGSYALSCAVSKHGGFKKFAEKLGLEIKSSESKLGEEYEINCMDHIRSLGYECEKMKIKHPYDLLINGCVKIDTKVSNVFNSMSNGRYYTFNLEKKFPTCDIFICYCIDYLGEISKTYIIPSNVISGKTQLSVGITKSKYDNFIDRWDILYKYINFNVNISKAL